jgi:regulator of cell morphogenesis and NO signaling
MVITSETPVRDIVVQKPNTIPVFEELRIDYCCGGKHTLAEACAKSHLSIDSVLNELEQQQKEQESHRDSWQTERLAALVDHIVQKHHAFTRTQLELIRDLAGKVERRHGSTHPEIVALNAAISTLASELIGHAGCEEGVLFPYIQQLEKEGNSTPEPFFGNISHPVSHMTADHDKTGTELQKIREITNNYQAPADACPTFKAFYRALQDLETDLHRHIHLENNILFPRAVALAHQQP